MRKSSFLKHINQLDEEDLRNEISLLYDKLDSVKKFYKMELGSQKDREKVYEAAKKKIASKYATKSYRKPRRPRIQKVNAILRDLKKEAIFSFDMIDIYLFTVETAMNFMEEYQFFSDPLFNNITNYFDQACVLIQENAMQSTYNARCKLVVDKSKVNRELYISLLTSFSNIK